MTGPPSDPSAHVFISDVHLGGFSQGENDRIEQELCSLVDFCERSGYKMYILGDLFDYWMEYENRVPSLGAELLERFRKLHQSGRFGPTLFIPGNHDHWTLGHFSSLGFDIERQCRTIALNGEKTLLLHGDGLNDYNPGLSYPLLNRFLRNKTFIKYYQKVTTPGAGLKVMKYFSRLNRLLEQLKTGPERLDRWAEAVLKSSGYDVIVCGHDHTPRMHEFSFGTYINLGTFYKHKTFAIYTNGAFQLVEWNSEAKQYSTFIP